MISLSPFRMLRLSNSVVQDLQHILSITRAEHRRQPVRQPNEQNEGRLVQTFWSIKPRHEAAFHLFTSQMPRFWQERKPSLLRKEQVNSLSCIFPGFLMRQVFHRGPISTGSMVEPPFQSWPASVPVGFPGHFWKDEQLTLWVIDSGSDVNTALNLDG